MNRAVNSRAPKSGAFRGMSVSMSPLTRGNSPVRGADSVHQATQRAGGAFAHSEARMGCRIRIVSCWSGVFLSDLQKGNSIRDNRWGLEPLVTGEKLAAGQCGLHFVFVTLKGNPILSASKSRTDHNDCDGQLPFRHTENPPPLCLISNVGKWGAPCQGDYLFGGWIFIPKRGVGRVGWGVFGGQ